jgi:hypothetical protein
MLTIERTFDQSERNLLFQVFIMIELVLVKIDEQ